MATRDARGRFTKADGSAVQRQTLESLKAFRHALEGYTDSAETEETLDELRAALANGDPFITISKPIEASGGSSHSVLASFPQVKPRFLRWSWRKRRGHAV